jgi:hypothetical protein
MKIFYFHTISFTGTRCTITRYGRGEGVKDKNSKPMGVSADDAKEKGAPAGGAPFLFDKGR